jgi:hypothetical protein
MSYNGLDVKNTFYIGSTNNQYAIRNGIDTLFVHACGKEHRTFVSATILNETDTIIGHKCRKFINDLEETKNHYWFDTTLYINPIHYQKHVFSYLNVYYEKTNSFWLKYKREGKAFDVIYTAIEINEKKLDDSIFELPLFPQKIE